MRAPLAVLLLLSSACATTGVERKMSFEEAFAELRSPKPGPAPESPAPKPAPVPPVSDSTTLAVEASISVELQSQLVAFSTRAREHRAHARRGPMPPSQIDNWERIYQELDHFLTRTAAQTASLDVIRARVTLEAELEMDVRAYDSIPPDMVEGVERRVGKLALRMAELRRLQVQPKAVKIAFAWPIEPVAVTSLFGERLHPITHTYRPHLGLDLAAQMGQLVTASAKGTVIRAEWAGAHGYHVEISHPDQVVTGYSHLSQLLVEPGTVVDQGDPVGLAGSTGQSTGVHLHFEFWRAGKPEDPLEEINGPAPTNHHKTDRQPVARR